MTNSRHRHIWTTIQGALREERYRIRLNLLEGLSFYVFRTDNNAVLARGIDGFEAAKTKANALRKSQGLKWDQVKFKAERGMPTSVPGSSAASRQPFGVSRDGRTFTTARGATNRIDYARTYNPSKGRRFRGYTDAQGNYHDID